MSDFKEEFMVQGADSPSLTHLMRMSTLALYECQDSLNQGVDSVGKVLPNTINAEQAESLLKLMETLVDTKIQMTNEIEADRVTVVDPDVLSQMEFAIENAINKPLDEKVNQIYFSIFGYNSALWQVLKDMYKLLKTYEILNQKTGRKIAKVHKTPNVKRKKRHEKDVLNSSKEEE